MEITDNLFIYINAYQQKYFWVFDGESADLSNENYIFCKKYEAFLNQLPPKVTFESYSQHTKLQEYISKLNLDSKPYWGLIVYIYTLHLIKYNGEYTINSSRQKRIQEIHDFIKDNIDNLEIIVRTKGEKKQRPFSITNKDTLLNLFSISEITSIEVDKIKSLLLDCINNDNTTINITIKAKKSTKSNVISLTSKSDMKRIFGIGELKSSIFEDRDIINIDDETPKPEAGRIFNYFYITELFKAIRLISSLPDISNVTLTDVLAVKNERIASADEKYLMLYTLDFLCLHSFDENTMFLNKDEELYYRNRLEYYNKLLIDYEGYISKGRGTYWYGMNIE